MSALQVLPVAPGPPLVELAATLPDSRWPMLFDSGPQPGPLARWHLLAFDPLSTLQRQARPGQDSFAELQRELDRCGPAPGVAEAAAAPPGGAGSELPPFRGGVAGWFGYDLGRELERLPELCAPDAELPDLCVGLFPFVLAEEVGTGRRLVVGCGTPAQGDAFHRQVLVAGEQAAALPPAGLATRGGTSSLDRQSYMTAVERVREHILDGDVYQVNLCQRFDLPYASGAAALQGALRERFPAPFGALLRVPGVAVVSSSPELFLRKRGARIESRPIKGTRPRHADPVLDRRLREELESSGKERAELAMIVDLVRNDLGRTASVGSVVVEGGFRTDAWRTVFHRSAVVSSRVEGAVGPVDVLRAAFPPASVTGTPKIAAQGIIERLEPVRRHVYTGAIGWIGADGDMDLSVAIRIATLAGGRLLASFGGGITLASEPAAEYEETLHKARALLQVLGVSQWSSGAGAC